MNIVILTKCNLTNDPEIKYTTSQKPVVNFSVAYNSKFGEKKEVSFFNCVAWNKIAELISQYLKKGSSVNITGRLQQRTWETKNGDKRQVIEIVVNEIDFLYANEKKQVNNEKPKDKAVNPFESVPENEKEPDFGDISNENDFNF